MNLLLIGWISLWIIKPTTIWIQSWRQAEDTARHTFFGYYGKVYMYLNHKSLLLYLNITLIFAFMTCKVSTLPYFHSLLLLSLSLDSFT